MSSSFNPHHLELVGGVLKTAGFPTGGYVFMVDLVEADGGRLTLWDGFDYSEAILVAEKAQREFALESDIQDVVGGPL